MLYHTKQTEIMNKFIKLPSGIVINSEKIEYFLGVNTVKEPRAKKPSCFTFSIQFIQRNDPITLSYATKEEATADYDALSSICN